MHPFSHSFLWYCLYGMFFLFFCVFPHQDVFSSIVNAHVKLYTYISTYFIESFNEIFVFTLMVLKQKISVQEVSLLINQEQEILHSLSIMIFSSTYHEKV